MLHIRPAQRVGEALSARWREDVQEFSEGHSPKYRDAQHGVAVDGIDLPMPLASDAQQRLLEQFTDDVVNTTLADSEHPGDVGDPDPRIARYCEQHERVARQHCVRGIVSQVLLVPRWRVPTRA